MKSISGTSGSQSCIEESPLLMKEDSKEKAPTSTAMNQQATGAQEKGAEIAKQAKWHQLVIYQKHNIQNNN